MKDKIQKLEEQILKHKALYYQGRPEISDHEYDELEAKLAKLDPKNPTLNLVGTTPRTGKKIEHESKMLSLNKTYELKELLDWKGEHDLLATFKIDGVSCSLVYEDGHLKLAKTRGDGSFGEDITSKVHWMSCIPKTIPCLDRIEVRGELFCREESFFVLSEEMEQLKLERPTSQRNIVAGLISRKDHAELCRHIEFYAFELLQNHLNLKREEEKYRSLRGWGLPTPDFLIVTTQKQVEHYLNEARDFMSEGDYQIDGIVFTYNELDVHQELGYTAHHPRYRIAFKFAGESKQTQIEEIDWSISRNGTLTPVARVTPVELSGATISRVTLHNLGMVKQFRLKKGDTIEIIRSGEVIPKFLSVVEDGGGDFVVPERGCDFCVKKLEQKDIRLVCVNKVCPTKDKEVILNFVQKMGIDDLSSKRLEEMLRAGLVQDIPSLYRLKTEDFLALDKVKEKLAAKFYENIEKSRQVDIITFLSALGISGGAYNKCEKVVLAGYDTLEKIKDLTIEKLVDIEGFAEKSAEEFLRSLKEKHQLIEQLEGVGFRFKERKVFETPVKGKKICITGALSEKRTVIEKRLRDYGAIVVGSVSKNTDYLLTNEQDSASSKFVKAQKFNVTVIDEEKLKQMLEQAE